MLTVHVLVHCVLGEVNVAYDEGQACKQQHWPSFAFVCTLWYLSVCHSLCTMWHTFWCTTWPRFWYPIGMPQTKCGTKSHMWYHNVFSGHFCGTTCRACHKWCTLVAPHSMCHIEMIQLVAPHPVPRCVYHAVASPVLVPQFSATTGLWHRSFLPV